MGVAGRALAQDRYAWEAIGRRLLEIYERDRRMNERQTAAPPLASVERGPASPSRSSSLWLVAVMLWWRGPSWQRDRRRIPASHVGSGSRSRSASTSPRSCARVRLAHGDPTGDAPAASRQMLVFSAFSVGPFANAVLPGRIGELARVAVLNRKMPKSEGPVGDARRHRLRAPRLRPRAGPAPHRSTSW